MLYISMLITYPSDTWEHTPEEEQYQQQEKQKEAKHYASNITKVLGTDSTVINKV